MPRFARLIAPGGLVHVIARFVNRQFRLAGEEERAAYLDKLGAILPRTDWRLLGYALMSSHVHLALLAGHDPPWCFLQPLHIAVARWINRHQGTFGPVFAERATTFLLPPERAGVLLAYLHNNPVRAGVVRTASGSPWTSHRAYLGLERPPPWLAVAEGLGLSGFDASPAGRLAFAELATAQAALGQAPMPRGPDLARLRAAVRGACGAPVEVASPVLGPTGAADEVVLRAPGPVPLRPRWEGDLDELLRAVQAHTGVPAEQMRRRCKVRTVVAARRLLLVTATRHLGRRLNEAAAMLGLSNSAASELTTRADIEDEHIQGILQRLPSVPSAPLQPRTS